MFNGPSLIRKAPMVDVGARGAPRGTVRGTPRKNFRTAVVALIRPAVIAAVAAGLVLGISAPASAAPGDSAGTHIVRSGDTLSAIAVQYGVSLGAVFSLNGLGWSSIIYPGDAIVLPASAAAESGSSSGAASTGTGSAAAEARTSGASQSASAGGTHTVRSGDTLSAIAAQYGVSLNTVFALNGLGWNSIIYPGDVIKLAAVAAGNAVPQPRQADAASGGSSQTPPVGTYSTSRGPNYTSRVVLTFDDCPGSLAQFTQVMTWAGNSNIGLVIAPTGNCISSFIAAYGVDIAAVARSHGQYVINHSVSHVDLTTLGCAGVANQLGAPGVVTNFGRPPYGAMNSAVYCGYAQAGMAPWTWDVDTMDWTGKSSSQVVAHAVQYAGPGSTVLMHLQWSAFSPSAIGSIQSGLAARGLDVCRAYGGSAGAVTTSPVNLPSSLPC